MKHFLGLLLLASFVGQVSSMITVNIKVSLVSCPLFNQSTLFDSSDFHACLSDYPARTCEPHGNDIERRRPAYFTREKLQNKTKQGKTYNFVLPQWKIWSGEKYLVFTSEDDGEYFNITNWSLNKGNSLNTTVLPTLFSKLRVTADVTCMWRFYGEDCTRGCEENRGWTCAPGTGAHICKERRENPPDCNCKKEWYGPYCEHATANRTEARANRTTRNLVTPDYFEDNNSSPSNNIVLFFIAQLGVIVVLVSALVIRRARKPREPTSALHESPRLLVAGAIEKEDA